MRTASWKSRSGAGCAALLAGIAGWSPSAFAVHNVFFSGHATGVVGTLQSGSTSASVLLADNQMSCSGIPQDETPGAVDNPAPLRVQSRNMATFTLGRDQTSTADASMESPHIALPDLTIDAGSIGAHAEVKCDFVPTHTNQAGFRPVYSVSGSASVGRLTINGQNVDVTGEPNQTINIPNVATIVVNEQARSSRSLIVSGLHVKLLDDSSNSSSGDVVFAYARAKLTCEP
jgi:hypothetical protein